MSDKSTVLTVRLFLILYNLKNLEIIFDKALSSYIMVGFILLISIRNYGANNPSY